MERDGLLVDGTWLNDRNALSSDACSREQTGKLDRVSRRKLWYKHRRQEAKPAFSLAREQYQGLFGRQGKL